MAPGEYGAVAVIMTLFAFLNTMTNAGLPSAAFRFYNEQAEDAGRQLTLGTSQLLMLLFAAVPAVGVLLFAGTMSQWLLGSPRYAAALQFAVCFLVVDSANRSGEIVLRIQVRPLATSVLSILAIALEAGLALLMVTALQLGAAGYWLGYFFGGTLGLAAMIWTIRKTIVFRASWRRAKELLAFGVPLIPAALSMTALRLADRYFIGSALGLEQVAIYDVGYKVGGLIALVLGPFRAAWQPFAFSIAGRPEARKVFRDVLSFLTAGCAFLILGVIAFRSELVALVAPESYARATDVVVWVAASQLLWAAYSVLAIGPMIVKQTRVLAAVALSAAALNVGLNLLLIPRIGILGAAIATFAAYGVLAILTYAVSQKSFPVPTDWRRLGIVVVAGAMVALLVHAVERWMGAGWPLMATKAAAVLCFPVVLLSLRLVTPGQMGSAVAEARALMQARLLRGRPPQR